MARDDAFGPLTHRQLEGGQNVWDFTLLFEDSILATGPLAVGVLFILTELSQKCFCRRSRTIVTFLTVLGWIKLVRICMDMMFSSTLIENIQLLYFALILLTTYHTAQLLAWTARGLAHESASTRAAAALSVVAVLLICLDNGLHHLYSLKPSSPSQCLLAWWLISDIATVRTRWLFGGHDRTLAYIAIGLAALKLGIIVAEEWSKRDLLLPPWLHNSPEALAGIINRLLLIWINPLIVRGLGGTIELEDLWPLEDRFASDKILSKMTEHGHTQNKAHDKHLFWMLLQEHWYLWLVPFPTRMAQAGFQFAQPFLLHQTLRWLYGLVDNSTAVGYGLLGGYAVTYTGIAVGSSILISRCSWANNTRSRLRSGNTNSYDS